MRTLLFAWFMVLVAVAAWAGFGRLILQLDRERASYVAAEELSKQETLRGESATRLRATIQGTEAERAAIEGLVGLTILQAVEAIEQAGEAAGANDVAIGEATPTNAPQGLAAVSIVVNASGSFGSLHRAISLFETLPIPAKLEQFELAKEEQSNSWRLTARLRVLYAPTQ